MARKTMIDRRRRSEFDSFKIVDAIDRNACPVNRLLYPGPLWTISGLTQRENPGKRDGFGFRGYGFRWIACTLNWRRGRP